MRKIGFLASPPEAEAFPPGYGEEERRIWRLVSPFTATDKNRLIALIESVRYAQRAGIQGSMVECGVWRGGSMMAIALTLLAAEGPGRELYLFDTFRGMAMPGEQDVNLQGESALSRYQSLKRPDGDGADWCRTPLDEVRRNLEGTGFPARHIHYVEGRVEDTVPGAAPESIAVLRLDTDFYESTLHEMRHLYPRLSPGGVLIVDDYHWWRGARQAVDEYLLEQGINLYLCPIDGGGVAAVKPP